MMSELAGKVSISSERRLGQYYPTAWPARVRVDSAMGRFEAEVIHCFGDPGRRMDGDQLSRKFTNQTRGIIGPTEANLFMRHAEALPSPSSVRQLLALLREVVGGF